MQYFVFETEMKKDAYLQPGFQEALAGHLKFTKNQFEQGIVLFSGAKPRNSGGIRVMKIADGEDVAPYWQNDPMAAAGMIEYRVTPFALVNMCDDIKEWFA